MSTKGGPVFTFSLLGGAARPVAPPSVTPLHASTFIFYLQMHFEERCTFNVDLYCTGTAKGGEDLERALSPCVTNSKLYCGRPEPDKILEKIAKISQR